MLRHSGGSAQLQAVLGEAVSPAGELMFTADYEFEQLSAGDGTWCLRLAATPSSGTSRWMLKHSRLRSRRLLPWAGRLVTGLDLELLTGASLPPRVLLGWRCRLSRRHLVVACELG